jgi:tight adherence protein B
MTAALGLTLGVGLLLVMSPVLWPRTERSRPPSAMMRWMRDRLIQAGLGTLAPGVVAATCGLLAVIVGALVQATLGVVPLTVAVSGLY